MACRAVDEHDGMLVGWCFAYGVGSNLINVSSPLPAWLNLYRVSLLPSKSEELSMYLPRLVLARSPYIRAFLTEYVYYWQVAPYRT